MRSSVSPRDPGTITGSIAGASMKVIRLRIALAQEMYQVTSPPSLLLADGRFHRGPVERVAVYREIIRVSVQNTPPGLSVTGDSVTRKGTPGAASCTSVAHLRVSA